MNITGRFVFLLSLGLLILGTSLIFHNSLSMFIIYNLFCAVLLIMDYLISPDQSLVEIERFGDDSLSIYEKEYIGIRVYNNSNYRLNLELRDEIPDFHFRTENKTMKGSVNPGEKALFKYMVIPTKRGVFKFKNIHTRYRGRLGLCTKALKTNLEKEYKVYPDLKNLRKYRLSIATSRLLNQGQKNIKALGRGTSFESLREYVHGDEYRKINWQATAREGKPIVNQYEPEKNQHVYIFIDSGRPMSYTVRGFRKLDMAVNTALVLSDIVNQNGDQSALLLFNTQVNNMIIPGKGAGHRNQILDALYHIDATNETSNYDEAFYHFKRKERHRSIVFLFTDFDTIEEAENMLKVLPVISKNNIVVIVLIKNEGLEEISNLKVHNQVDLFNKGVALELLDERRKIIGLLNRRGILCVESEVEKIEHTAINKYIQIKNRGYL